jgi:hypothetical protein
MSLISDPKNTFKVTLACDEGKEKPPWFEFRYRSIGDMRQISLKIDEIKHAVTDQDDTDKLLAIIQENLTGWGNQTDSAGAEVMFEAGNLEKVVSLADIGDLLFAFRAQGLMAADRKNSGSQSPSSTGPAAETAKE